MVSINACFNDIIRMTISGPLCFQKKKQFLVCFNLHALFFELRGSLLFFTRKRGRLFEHTNPVLFWTFDAYKWTKAKRSV